MDFITRSAPMPRRRVKDWAWRAMRHASAVSDVRCLRRLFPEKIVTSQIVDAYFDELAAFAPLGETIGRYCELTPGTLHEKLEGPGRSLAVLLYVATRLAQPNVVVESGCFSGWASALLLSAMHYNGVGHLFSIDLPAKSGQFGLEWGLPDGVSPGFLVPELLRHRWTLILGNATRELMPLLGRQTRVDMFFHDSDHSYGHMMWEYCTIWPSLNSGGLLVSDDIGWNASFWDFAVAGGQRWAIHKSNPNLGAIRKMSVAPSES